VGRGAQEAARREAGDPLQQLAGRPDAGRAAAAGGGAPREVRGRVLPPRAPVRRGAAGRLAVWGAREGEGPEGAADAIRAAAGRRWAPYGPCWRPLRGAGPTPCSSSAGWRAPDLGDEGARRLLQRIAGEAIAATTDTEPPADIRFRGVVHLTAVGGAEECGKG
jgi:hypothetical protein